MLQSTHAVEAGLEPATGRAVARRGFVLFVVCLAQFVVVLDATIVNVALPSIQRDLGFSILDLQWVVNAYALLFGGCLLLGGRAADLFGRQRVLLAGIALFTAASLLNALASSPGLLIAGRALQGFGAALVSPAALSIITTTYTDEEGRARALGVWSAMTAGGGAVGLLLGGVLTASLSWEWIFLVNLPVGAAAFLLAARVVPDTRGAGRWQGVDVAGAVAVTSGLIGLVYGIVRAEAIGWGSARTLATLGLAAIALVAFVAIERRATAPLLPLGILRSGAIARANVVMVFVASGMFAMFFFASVYVQNVLGYSALEAGLAFLPVTVGIMVGAGAAHRLIRRHGARAVALIGMVIAALGLLLFTRVSADGTYVVDVLGGLLAVSGGMGLTFVSMTLLATADVPEQDAGLASGLFNTARQVGGALGLAALSSLAATRTDDVAQGDRITGLVDGFQLAFAGAAVLMGIAVLLLALPVRRPELAAPAIAPGE